MARPKGGYRLKDGTRVPGTTTIVGRFKESGGLIHWAWNLGMEGKNYRDERDKAADAGTLAHEMIEILVAGGDPSTVEGSEEQMPKAVQALDAFRLWLETTKIEIIEQEMVLVSEQHRFGGTPDAVGQTPSGEYVLLDWKTSNRIYQDYLLQIAAYRLLWQEAHPDKPLAHCHLLRIGKEYADFHHHSWPSEAIDVALEQFLLFLEAYERDKKLKKIAGV